MSIPRRTSPSFLESASQDSGVYSSALGKRLDELDEAFEDEFPDLPSLTPGPRDLAMTKAALPRGLAAPFASPVGSPVAAPPAEVPDLVFNTPVRPPAFRTSSSSNIAAIRAPEARLPAIAAPELHVDSAPPPTPIALNLPVRPRPAPAAPDSRVFDSFDDDNVDIPLDIKLAPKNQVALQTMSGAEMAPAAAITSTQRNDDPRPGIVAFAGYGLPPESIGAMPAYAVRVIMRKWTLRDDLRVARLRRIQDVSLYEAALEAADESAVTKGLALIAATLLGGVSAVAAAAAFLL